MPGRREQGSTDRRPAGGTPDTGKEVLMSDTILTVKEAAEYLRMREQTLYRLVNQKKIPSVKIGGQWKIKKSSIDKMFEDAAHG
jgi:excisionase family DNA binding protein